MSQTARIFGEGYRGDALATEELLGVSHLVSGQYDAIWSDDEHRAIELSYVHQLGHQFIVVMLDTETLNPIKSLEAGVFGTIERPAPAGFVLNDLMRAAIDRLKEQDVPTA